MDHLEGSLVVVAVVEVVMVVVVVVGNPLGSACLAARLLVVLVCLLVWLVYLLVCLLVYLYLGFLVHLDSCLAMSVASRRFR